MPTWDQLADLLGRTDFLYVADSKLASTAAMTHLHTRGGRFITVLPRTRKEDTWFRNWAQTHTPDWSEAHQASRARAGAPATVFSVFTSPLPSAEGHRIIWVHSTDKAARDGATRQRRIEAGTAAIETLNEPKPSTSSASPPPTTPTPPPTEPDPNLNHPKRRPRSAEDGS